MLVLPADCPSEAFLMRFFSEKLFAVQLGMSCFLQNKKGFPVLSQQHANIVKTFMKIQCKIVIQPRHPNDCWDKHFKYLAHLFSKHDCLDPEEKLEVGYRNYL